MPWIFANPFTETRIIAFQDVILAVYFSITVWSAYHRIAHDIAVGHHFSMIWLIDHGTPLSFGLLFASVHLTS